VLDELVASNGLLRTQMAERERAEAVARASEQRFMAMFQSSPSGMVVSSLPDLRYVDVNESWLQLTGYSREQVIGKTADDVGLIDAHERALIYATMQRTGGMRNVDLRFQTRGGETSHGLVSAERLAVNGDTFQVTTLVDITDRVRAEADLRDSNLRLESTLAELRVAQQRIVERERIGALGQLASGIAHDFNNTLGPILGYSDLLLANPQQLANVEAATEYVRAINTAAQGAAGVVSRLRDFYRRRHNGDAHRPVRLSDVIAQAISITQPRWKDQAQASGAMIEVRADVGDVPPIEGSPSELRDALVNLILNAVDAMSAGGTITLRAYTEQGQRDRPDVLVEVVDTGTGMTDEVQRRCLEPFFTTKGEHGTGLGLSIVHGMLRRHAGLLEIESAVGQGTTMRLRLSAGSMATDDLPVPPEPEPPTRRVLRVLVVDDEPMMREMLSRFLTLDEHVAEVSASGREALARLQAGPPFDLVITDRAMPEMGGDELAAMIKVLAPSMPILMLTGFADLMGGVDERPAGVDLVIGKPTTLARLRVAIATLTGDPAPAYDLNAQLS
jgi:PAS domain S-box-containing protein